MQRKIQFCDIFGIYEALILSAFVVIILGWEPLTFQISCVLDHAYWAEHRYPTDASFSCSRFVVVCGDGEYIIYTAMALRNKSFGSAQEFVWAHDSSE